MKAIKYSVFFILLICVGYFYGMKRGADDATSEDGAAAASAAQTEAAQAVPLSGSGGGAAAATASAALPVNQVYFSPANNDQNKIGTQLLNFLNQATREILVASYLINNRAVAKSLIQGKRKGIDVQVIVDEKALDNNPVIQDLRDEGIRVLIYPSSILKAEISEYGVMHNKFAVVDGRSVFTGSANFTNGGLNRGNTRNYENIVIINDRTFNSEVHNLIETKVR